MAKYTGAEFTHICQLRDSGLTYEQIAVRVGRTRNGIRNFFYLRGLTEPKHWTDDEVSLLRSEYLACDGKPLNLDAIAKKLGRSRASVACMANGLGLTDQKRPGVEVRKDAPKYATREEQLAALSAYRREWFRTHEHPRGFLGKHHRAESKIKMVTAHKSSPEDRSRRARKAAMTRLERYGSAGPVYALTENAYSRTKSGKREDLGGLFLRSSWEANYARYLNWLIEQGEILSWEYEADTFIFHGETRGAITYRPDFKITERDGSVVYHEVKGWMDGPSKTRLKRMKKHYPDVVVIVIGESEYKAISKWRDMIPNWEGK